MQATEFDRFIGFLGTLSADQRAELARRLRCAGGVAAVTEMVEARMQPHA